MGFLGVGHKGIGLGGIGLVVKRLEAVGGIETGGPAARGRRSEW
jgi:hypothetical protein